MMKELKDNGFNKHIKDDESLRDAGVMDSLGLLIVISFLQDKFGIVVDADELNTEDFNSINALCGFIEKNTK